MQKKSFAAAVRAAFPHTIPIMTGYLAVGLAYGVLMASKGYNALWSGFVSAFAFCGSMQYVAITLLTSAFDPVQAFLLSLMVNARHLFYGLSLLDKFKNLVCYVVSEDDSIPLTIRLSGEINALRLFSGTEEINSLNLDLFDLNNAYISADLSKINKSDECYLICGFYKSNRLVNAKMFFGEMKEKYDISSNEDIDFDEIRLFMFDSPNKCIPLCGASLIKGKTENEKRKV